MEQGVLCLKEIYEEFVRKYAANIDAYRINRRSGLGHDYNVKCDALLREGKVPDEQGFYLWGFYNPKRFWVNVYVGKAGKGIGAGKTDTLKTRLYKELTAERASVWREGNRNNARVLEIGKEIHPTMWAEYESRWVRAPQGWLDTHLLGSEARTERI